MSEEVKKATAKVQTPEEMERELKALELESKRLEVAEKKANLQDLQERLAERELKRENRSLVSKTNGATLAQLAANDIAAQTRCNHQKGGNGADGVVAGQGDDPQYAVLKHTFANNDTWIRCLRCGKTWKPVLREWFTTDAAFQAAEADYRAALKFQTRNVPSAGVKFQFSDNGKSYRELTRNANLR